MPVLPQLRRCRLPVALMLILSLVLLCPAMAVHLKDDTHTVLDNVPFSMLILGDSEMAGAGWEGGYANCILETYPNAQVINLAQNGSLLANGDIHRQWEFFLTEGFDMPDFVLLDGGINDLPYMKREEFAQTGMGLVSDALRSIIELIHEASPDTRIIYIMLPPLEEWKDTDSGPPSYEAQERYWKEMSIIASQYDHVTVLDLFALNPFHYPCRDCYQENFADSVHLSEAGYRNTFEYIENMLMARLVKKLTE